MKKIKLNDKQVSEIMPFLTEKDALYKEAISHTKILKLISSKTEVLEREFWLFMEKMIPETMEGRWRFDKDEMMLHEKEAKDSNPFDYITKILRDKIQELSGDDEVE